MSSDAPLVPDVVYPVSCFVHIAARLTRQASCDLQGRVHDGQMQRGSLKTQVFRAEIEGVPVALIRPDWDRCNIFRGQRIYGGSYNEVEAYLYFCRAALEYLERTNRHADVLHLHEWQASAAALLYWDHFHKMTSLKSPKVMLTLHNTDSTGEVRQDEFAVTGVDGALFATVERALDERTIGHNPERLNLLKGGINYSNIVTTVSPTYRKETAEGGAGWLRYAVDCRPSCMRQTASTQHPRCCDWVVGVMGKHVGASVLSIILVVLLYYLYLLFV